MRHMLMTAREKRKETLCRQYQTWKPNLGNAQPCKN